MYDSHVCAKWRSGSVMGPQPVELKVNQVTVGAFSGIYKHRRVSLLLRQIATIYDRCLTQRDTHLQLLIHSPLANTMEHSRDASMLLTSRGLPTIESHQGKVAQERR
jgi:hypothetical protein